MMTTREKLGNIALIIGLFVAAGSIAPHKAKAIPIETSNSPIFEQDYTGTIGIDVNSNKPSLTTRPYSYGKDNLFFGNKAVVLGKDNQLFDKATHKPVLLPDHTPATLANSFKQLTGSCNGGQLVGQNCQTKSVYTDITAYGQGAARIGGNTALLGGWDSNGRTAYGAAAVKLDNLTLTAGGDRFGVTGSAAYSLGSFSPFYAYQRGISNYGADYRLSDNFSINGGYRSDNTYFVGARIDVGGNFDKPKQLAAVPVQPVARPGFVPFDPMPPKPELICETGYRKFMDTCVKLLNPIERAPKGFINRARG